MLLALMENSKSVIEIAVLIGLLAVGMVTAAVLSPPDPYAETEPEEASAGGRKRRKLIDLG